MAISASGSQLGLPVLIVDDVVFLALASIAVFARIWARYIPKSKLCFNDYIISLALITRTEFYAVVRRRAGNKSQYGKRKPFYAKAEATTMVYPGFH
ncbi:predicted protein [Sclerotinia sclerotiorum 1980 UF-70]|uniref:Uncharacterized protein n=1 Tax=Sclerotinia sclerotiorum (strain ATCC 18683 / 1980 / Ss-1) TaxID=665079 RepID=A7E5S5_SCLS1|nr:predicted protein [Sclerotinia sclerotiorum 1980 UF-70]EDN91247.1 predicted protein [Sclerotinia sclerotiorum 1980 UF-70]